MRKKSTLLNYLFLICLAPSITFSQISSPQIDSLVAVALLKFKVAGAAVAVVKDGKVIHSKGYGLADINSIGYKIIELWPNNKQPPIKKRIRVIY